MLQVCLLRSHGAGYLSRRSFRPVIHQLPLEIMSQHYDGIRVVHAQAATRQPAAPPSQRSQQPCTSPRLGPPPRGRRRRSRCPWASAWAASRPQSAAACRACGSGGRTGCCARQPRLLAPALQSGAPRSGAHCLCGTGRPPSIYADLHFTCSEAFEQMSRVQICIWEQGAAEQACCSPAARSQRQQAGQQEQRSPDCPASSLCGITSCL
jgi:hypothetical protein